MHKTHHKRSTNQYFEVECIGNLAYDSLPEDQGGTVLGVTSRGAFIKTENRFLLFLSFESFHGPLTINIPIREGLILPIRGGMNLQITGREITFLDAGLVVSIQDPVMWQPEPPSLPPLSLSERNKRLTSSAKRILAAKKKNDLAGTLPRLLHISRQTDQHPKDFSPLQAKMIKLQSELMSSSHLPAAETLISLLGSGSGLTPSGDDLIIGVLLALNRWKIETVNGQDLDRLNQEIVENAYRKTTTLSANLIECATLGLADERLIEVLDWLVSGREKESNHIDELLGWGSSSGIDVFVGFTVALSS